MTYPKFEEIWQSKFRDVQENPSEAVWQAIAWQIGYKERQRKKWITWWAAALIAFFLGDGRLVYNFYGKLFDSNWQNEAIVQVVPEIGEKENKPTETFITTKSQNINKTSATTPQEQKFQGKTFFSAEAAYELAQEKVASKRPQEEIPLEQLGKPKKRAWWLKTYTNGQYVQNIYKFNGTQPLILGRTPNGYAMSNLQKEIASFKHIFSWGVGAEIAWQFHKNFYLSSGLHWQRSLFGFNSNSHSPELVNYWGKLPDEMELSSLDDTPASTETIVVEADADMSMITDEPKVLPTYHFTQKIENLIVPIKIGYQKVGNRWQYGFALGVENSYLLNNSFQSDESNFERVFENTNRLQLAALAEISVGLRLNHKTSLHISPSFRRFLTSPIVKNPDLQLSKYSFGVGAGLQIGL